MNRIQGKNASRNWHNGKSAKLSGMLLLLKMFKIMLIMMLFLLLYRFCVGDKFYLCDNKILCEYDYEERLVFASMANHPILKRNATVNLPGTPPSLPSIPTSVPSPIQQNGHHHGGLLSNLASSPRSQNNDMNNNQNGLNGVTSPFGTPGHMKQVITTN